MYLRSVRIFSNTRQSSWRLRAIRASLWLEIGWKPVTWCDGQLVIANRQLFCRESEMKDKWNTRQKTKFHLWILSGKIKISEKIPYTDKLFIFFTCILQDFQVSKTNSFVRVIRLKSLTGEKSYLNWKKDFGAQEMVDILLPDNWKN